MPPLIGRFFLPGADYFDHDAKRSAGIRTYDCRIQRRGHGHHAHAVGPLRQVR